MKRLMILLVLAAVTSGCATGGGLAREQTLALYEQHAGEPVRSFRFLGRINNWTPLGDSAVAVWTRPSEAWLLELNGPCQDLSFSQAIALSSSMNTVHAGFDRVTPISPGRHTPAMPCHIQTIRPLDVAALRTAQRQARETEQVMDATAPTE